MSSSLLGLIPELDIQGAILSTCDISEFGFRYPLGCVPVQVCYIQSIIVYVLSSIGTLVRSGGMRLYRAIFVIYAYDCILYDSCRTV